MLSRSIVEIVERRMPLNQLARGGRKNHRQSHPGGGTVAVMAINALLAKTISHHNPKNEFFVEESFPLEVDVSAPEPHGVIHETQSSTAGFVADELLQKDQSSGSIFPPTDWRCRPYDIPLLEVTQWIEKTYLRSDFSGFTGDRKFIHDIDAQSLSRNCAPPSRAVYAGSLSPQCPPAVPNQDK